MSFGSLCCFIKYEFDVFDKTNDYFLLDDGQIVSWGYIFDALTTNRILSFYKNFPKLAQWWQVF